MIFILIWVVIHYCHTHLMSGVSAPLLRPSRRKLTSPPACKISRTTSALLLTIARYKGLVPEKRWWQRWNNEKKHLLHFKGASLLKASFVHHDQIKNLNDGLYFEIPHRFSKKFQDWRLEMPNTIKCYSWLEADCSLFDTSPWVNSTHMSCAEHWQARTPNITLYS